MLHALETTTHRLYRNATSSDTMRTCTYTAPRSLQNLHRDVGKPGPANPREPSPQGGHAHHVALQYAFSFEPWPDLRATLSRQESRHASASFTSSPAEPRYGRSRALSADL